MKKVLLMGFLFSAGIINAQQQIQPISSGDYYQSETFADRLPALANKSTFPTTINFPNGYVGITNFKANRIIGVNEIYWDLSGAENVAEFYIEFSRDLKTFERAGIVQLVRTDGQNSYVFRHTILDNKLIYYRLALANASKIVAYTPAIQVLDEKNTTKVYPTLVQGSTFYIQTAQAYEKLQVLNSANVAVMEKGLNSQTGTITIGLPALPSGIYFVRLLSQNQPQFVERLLIQ